MKNIIETFVDNCHLYNNKVAIKSENKSILYTHLYKEVQQIAYFFENIVKIERDDKVLIILDNNFQYSSILLALAALGAVGVPISTTFKQEAIQKVIDASDVTYIIAEGRVIRDYLKENKFLGISSKNIVSFHQQVENCHYFPDIYSYNSVKYDLRKHTIPANQDFIIIFTSGSTGDPKPIVLSQKNKIDRALKGAKELYNLDASDIILSASPFYHSLGLRLILLPLLIGATSVLIYKFTPKIWLDSVEKMRVTFTIAVSSQLEAIVKSDFENDLSSLKNIVSSSSLLQDSKKEKCIKKFHCDFHECYGASEIGIATNLSPEDAKNSLSSVGKTLPYTDIKIVDAQNRELSIDKIGEITCKTETMFSRYYKKETLTRKSIVNDYFFTGDLGYIDEKGYLHFTGRKKDLIIVGGTNVYPKDIEDVVLQVKGVKECAVIGVDDKYFGEIVLCLLVVEREKFELKNVKLACLRHLADYQQPMGYEVIKELPKNNLGKVMKYKLKELFQGYDATMHFRKLIKKGS